MSCHIVYDVDDVLADFWGSVLPLFNKEFGCNLSKNEIVNYTSFAEHCGNIEHFFEFIRSKVDLVTLEPTDYLYTMNEQYDYGNTISIVTSRDYLPSAYGITQEWLQKVGAKYHNLYISGSVPKSSFFEKGSVDLVYDDHCKNIDDYFDSGVMHDEGFGVIIDQPWNQDYSRKRVLRKLCASGVYRV